MKRFDSPDHVREFDKGKFEIIDVKLDNRKTKNLQDTKNSKVEIVSKPINNKENKNTQINKPTNQPVIKYCVQRENLDSFCFNSRSCPRKASRKVSPLRTHLRT